MKSSFYNIFFEKDNHKYVYNTLSTGIAELDDDTYLKLKNNEIVLSEDNYHALAQAGYIVDDSADEYNRYLFFYNSVRFGKSASNFILTFVPTYGCNLACPYCMQGQEKNPKRISSEEINSIINFCRKQISKTEESGQIVKQLFVNLFGGEPTLYKEELMFFCKNIKHFAEEKGIPVFFLMTSNFTMIDESLIDFIEEYDISTQVSIDGTQEQHDLRRKTKTGSGTFKTIISNLEKMRDRGLKSKITIRINLDKDNLSDAEAILKELMPYSDDIYFGYLDSFSGKNDEYNNCIDCNDYSTINTSKLDGILKKYGYLEGGRRFGKQAPCSINSMNKYFVDCNLDVYKCDMLLNNPKMRVGTIAYDGTFIPESGYYNQMSISPERYPKCRYCKLLPLCGSGCAGKSYFKNSVGSDHIDKENCSFTESDLVSYLINYISRS